MKIKKNKIYGTREIIVESINEVDMSGLSMPIIAVYKNPEDYPDKCVARIFDMDAPTNVIILTDNVNQIQQELRKFGMHFLDREPGDIPALVGTYI